jgi:hypothetical protein
MQKPPTCGDAVILTRRIIIICNLTNDKDMLVFRKLGLANLTAISCAPPHEESTRQINR